MNLLNILPAGSLKFVAGTSGGEHAGPCPWCGGIDRFRVWPDHPSGATGGRYMCRGCGQFGDGIQFLRDSVGLSYSDACRALQVAPKATTGRTAPKPQVWTPKPTTTPTEIWQGQAVRFVTECAANMAPESEGMAYAASRGLTPDTVKALRIGWNPQDRWEDRQAWGLEPGQNTKGNPKRVWLPAGLVVPSHSKADITALKVRRTAWTPEDTLPKYVALPGSVPGLALGCDTEKPVVLVESELDAMLVWQEARELVGTLALATASGKPDTDTAAYLRTVPRILVALDFDRAGIEAFHWWPAHFPQAEPWPVVQGKDVGDMAGTPGLVRAWIELATVPEPDPTSPAWPEPEPGPIETVTPAGKYALLFALVSVFGAVLTKDAGGGLTLMCPATMPQEAAQAAQDGLAELSGHLQMRLAGGT